MNEFMRVAIASRAFSLAAIVGLAIAFGNNAAVVPTLIVFTTAAASSYLTHLSSQPAPWVMSGEAAVASLVVVSALPESGVLLPYLVVLPLLAGLVRGIPGTSLVIAAQLTVMGAGAAAYGGLGGSAAKVELLAPWGLTIIGAGLLGAWGKKLGKSPAGSETDERYESARRLLGQLRTLARCLPTGLDPVTIADQMLTATEGQTSSPVSAVFTRTEGGVFAPLAYHGTDARERIDHQDPVIRGCWESGAIASRATDVTTGQGWQITALPLRLASEIVGVLVCCSAEPIARDAGESLQRDLDELSLRLATALAFDEVRDLVTGDERQRLAREIHDGIAQEVASLGYVVDELSHLTSEPEVVSGLHELRGELSRVVSDLRLSIFDLRSEVRDGPGLGSAISDHLRKVGARSAMTVHLTLDEAPTRLSTGVEAELFRIAQEAITNARKHSRAKNLWVDCRVQPPSASITVRDDGRGVGTGRADSYGLRIMQERAERIGANVAIGASRGGQQTGTCVTISLGDLSPTAHHVEVAS